MICDGDSHQGRQWEVVKKFPFWFWDLMVSIHIFTIIIIFVNHLTDFTRKKWEKMKVLWEIGKNVSHEENGLFMRYLNDFTIFVNKKFPVILKKWEVKIWLIYAVF